MLNEKEGTVKKLSLAVLVMLSAVIVVTHCLSFAAPAGPIEKTGSKSAGKAPAKAMSLASGRYLAKIAGCNDCHTKGWIMTAGNVPETDWLTGDITGWWGPWGTTYAFNLRLFFSDLTEEAWIRMARTLQARPLCPGMLFGR